MGQHKNDMMEAEARGWYNTGKYVCAECFQSPPLQEAINRNLAVGHQCDFCSSINAASLDFLMEEHIMPSILEEYTAAEDELVWSEGKWVGKAFDTGDLIDDVFFMSDVCKCEALLNEIKESIIFSHWCTRDHYGMKSDEIRLFYWQQFAKIVKHSNRYFFVDAVIGIDVDNHNKTTLHFLSDLKTIIETELLTSIPSDSLFYRARIGTEKYATLHELGAPAYSTSTHANRMSPAGVSMLYGAFDPETAKREAGSVSKENALSLASIKLKRQVKVIDFCNLPESPDFFELGHLERRFLCNFLQEFVKDLRKPVEKDGREHIDYVPTQVLTEYLKSCLKIDGMIFPSARHEEGKNLVLWGKDFVPYNEKSALALQLESVKHHGKRTASVCKFLASTARKIRLKMGYEKY